MQLKYSNYVAFIHFHGKAVNNSGYFIFYLIYRFFPRRKIERTERLSRSIEIFLLIQLIYNISKERRFSSARLLSISKTRFKTFSIWIFFVSHPLSSFCNIDSACMRTVDFIVSTWIRREEFTTIWICTFFQIVIPTSHN